MRLVSEAFKFQTMHCLTDPSDFWDLTHLSSISRMILLPPLYPLHFASACTAPLFRSIFLVRSPYCKTGYDYAAYVTFTDISRLSWHSFISIPTGIVLCTIVHPAIGHLLHTLEASQLHPRNDAWSRSPEGNTPGQ